MPKRGASCSAERIDGVRRARALVARTFTVALATLLVGLTFFSGVTFLSAPTAAGAESPTLVALELAVDGVWVAEGRTDVDEPQIAEAIQQARARGLRLVVVAPLDPQPDPASFARRVLEASDADAAVVFPTEGGLEARVIEEFQQAGFRAQEAARAKSDPTDAVVSFTDELLAEPDRSLPPIIRQILFLVLLLALILGGALAIEQILRRMQHERAARSVGN